MKTTVDVVPDIEAPIFQGCPQNIERVLPTGESIAVITYVATHLAQSRLTSVVGLLQQFQTMSTLWTTSTYSSTVCLAALIVYSLPVPDLTSVPQGLNICAGRTTVRYIATDAAENVRICSFEVHIVDQEKPRFSTCPTEGKTVNSLISLSRSLLV